MPDDHDRSQEVERLALEIAIQEQLHRARTYAPPVPVGHCQNPACGEDFEPESPRIYCNRECEQEHNRRKKVDGNKKNV